MTSKDLVLDVTDAVSLGEDAHIAVTVTLPDMADLPETPIVCFGKPGGGYSKGYYTMDLPGPARGAQAEWHAKRGWIFVSVDHLGVGSSSTHHSPHSYTFTNVAAANQAAEQQVIRRLEEGELVDGFPPVPRSITIGIGQSLGGCLTVVQQGRYDCYDGVGVLGFSAVHTHPPTPPGTPPFVMPWRPRDVIPDGRVPTDPTHEPCVVNKTLMAQPNTLKNDDPAMGEAMAWGFHYDDVDPEIVRADLTDFPRRNGHLRPWDSATMPMVAAAWGMAPGVIAPEAAGITVPMLVAMGERDVIADPKGEPRAYLSAISVDLYRCPRMGHMHNFASTRELFWQRIENFGNWVRTQAGDGTKDLPYPVESDKKLISPAW